MAMLEVWKNSGVRIEWSPSYVTISGIGRYGYCQQRGLERERRGWYKECLGSREVQKEE